MRKLLLLLLCVASSLVVNASDFYVDGIYYNKTSDNTVAVTYGYDYHGNRRKYTNTVVIPNTVTDYGIEYTVTAIGKEAFRDCSGLVSVNIPNSVTSIGYGAFYGCSGLVSVNMPNSVTSIGELSFRGCSGLVSINIPNSVTSISYGAFRDCSGLISINIPNSVTSIGQYAFKGCSGLDSVHIPSTVTSIGKWAFDDCSSLTTIDINSDSILEGAFEDCTNLKYVKLSNNIKYIDNSYENIFNNCDSISNVEIKLENQTDFLNYLKRKDLYRIFHFTTLENIKHTISIGGVEQTSISIPEGTDTIGSFAFRNCQNITNVSIPNSVTYIGEYAFWTCSSLESINIPSSVISMGNYVFEYCTGLKSASVHSAYLGKYSFRSCTSLKKVSFYSPLKEIDYYSFCYCSALSSIEFELPSTLSSIGAGAFFGTNLSSIKLPSSLSSLGSAAFDNTKIKEVVLPDNLFSISNNTFPDSAEIYVNRGTYTLLAAWDENMSPYQVGTHIKLVPPSIIITDTTQTTATYLIQNKYDEFKYIYHNYAGIQGNVTKNPFKVNGLVPNEGFPDILVVKNDSDVITNHCCKLSANGGTKPINPILNLTSTASSISAKGSYIKGDAKVIYSEIEILKNYFQGDIADSIGLDPNSNISVRYRVYVKSDVEERNNSFINGLRYRKSYYASKDINTEELELETRQPKVINSGNVIVQATSNLDEREPNAGFEWRRTDWTDDFASNTGNGYTYDGVMEGYIRNLNTNYLWKYRPYYESNSGNRYYGEWVGIDPSNTSYFEPTVHTYDNVNVNGNTAKVKGYAQRGTDNVTEQGFMYWKNNGASAKVDGANYAPSIPSDAQTVTVRTNSGNPIMETTLTALDFNSDYSFVAFVTTTDGTFYGEEQAFTTGSDPTGIIEVEADEPQQHKYPAGIYDLNGRKLQQMQRGVNIVRFEDGTVKKILVK